MPTLLDAVLATIRQVLVKQDFMRENALSIKGKHRELKKEYLETFVKNLTVEEITSQLQKVQDRYQVTNKAFHCALELLDA